MDKDCLICGSTFDVKPRFFSITLACSDGCKRALAKERDRRNGKKKVARRRAGITTKTCVVCEAEFTPLRNVATCSEACRLEARKQRLTKWHGENKERTREARLENQRKRYWSDPERRRGYANNWYEANRNRILQQIKNRHVADPERRRKLWRDWHRKHPLKARTKNRNRYALKMAAPGKHTAEDIVSILKAQKYRCAYCRTKLNGGRQTHVDHIVALARGGSNDKSNLQMLCDRCNCSKNSQDPIDYAQSVGLLL